MIRTMFTAAFLLGALAIVWIGTGFLGTDWLALTVTLLIGIVYGLGCFEMLQFRRATATLDAALLNVPGNLQSLDSWLQRLHPSLQNSVRLRIEGERMALPGPVFTPYLVGLLVMLGLLGTFVGMVVTLNGAVFALEGTTELQAIRAGLAAPIKGLGLAFGTSVAGVAASAMLGLISTLSRRERIQATGLLDASIAGEFRHFSLLHNRQETFKAMQFQAQALPQVAERLQTMADNMERMTQAMTQAVTDGQSRFQETATQTFTQLAAAVQQSLQESLADSGRLAGESIKPIVEAAMTEVAEQAQQTQQQLSKVGQSQLEALAGQFSNTAKDVSSAWQAGLSGYEQSQQKLVESIDASLGGFNRNFESGSIAVLERIGGVADKLLQQLACGDEQRLQQWQTSLQGAADAMVQGWRANGEQMLKQQQTVLEVLQDSSGSIVASTEKTSNALLSEWAQVLQQSGDMLRNRMASEQTWLDEQALRMENLTATIRDQLNALRNEESARAGAAVERLSALEATAAGHLAQLGSALEQPMTRLIETASQAPKAAAEVIEQLRQEISNNIERDNGLLEERQRIMEDLNGLLVSMEKASGEQRAAIETLVTASTQQLAAVSDRFGQHVEAETGKLSGMAANLESSAVEVASLGEAFGFAVELFSESNNKLIENLNRIEETLEKSTTRSDEQLAYYVAQAKEIIDLSMLSQKEIIEELRLKAESEPTVAEEVS